MSKAYRYYWITAFDGDDDGAAAAGDGDAGATAAAAAAAAAASAAGAGAAGDAGGDDKTFTQEQVNTMMAKEKREHETRTQKALGELKALQTRANLTTKERSDLESRVEQMQNELLTKEQLATKEKEKSTKAHEKVVEDITVDRDAWKERFTQSTILRSIQDAAIENGAVSPDQIVRMLGSDTRLVEEMKDGAATGKLVPQIKMDDVDKDGKPVTLDLVINEAVKRMSDMEQHGNLFRAEGAGGIGGTNQDSGRPPDIVAIAEDPVAYRKGRADGTIDL